MKSSTIAKLVGSFCVIGTAASLAGLGTFATFTSSTSASQSIQSGTVAIALGSAGTAANRLTIGATNLVAGDTVQRALNLTSTSTDPLASVQLTTTASPSSVLDTDATNGLQMVIDKCSVAWTEAGTAPAYTYTCAGSSSTVIASRAVIGSALPMTTLAALASGSSTDYLRVTLTLPTTADNTFQGKSSSVLYTFVGTQRAATNR
jgi:predicted ribosomally synthesized peptide with SipW-like signal peptide